MKIKIITNSNETIKAFNAISNINLSHGFSFGPDKNCELSSENSWFSNIFKILDSQISKILPIHEKERIVIDNIANSTKKLNDFLEHNHDYYESIDYLKNSSLFIHSESTFNKFIRKFSEKYFKYAYKLDLEYHVYKDSSSFKKILAGVQYVHPSAFLESRKIIMNSSVFSKETDISFGYNILTDISQNFGTQKTVDFTLLHEFSHITQDINNLEYGNRSDIKFYNISRIISSLAQNDFHFYKTSFLIDSYLNKNSLVNDSSFIPFTPLDRELLIQLDILQKEVYADVGSLLHMRNIDISDGTYQQDDLFDFIDHVIATRHKEHNYMLLNHSDNIDKFDHFTVEGIKTLKEKIKSLNTTQILSQEDIHHISQDCLTSCISRVMLTIASIHPKLNSQIKNLFYLKINTFTSFDEENQLSIDLITDFENSKEHSKYIKGMDHLKKLSGKIFVDRLTDIVHNAFSIKIPVFDIRQIVWKSVFENPSYLKDIKYSNENWNDFYFLENELNSKDKSYINRAIFKLRNSFLFSKSNNNKQP